MSDTPLPNGRNGNGRDTLGRFITGNQAAAGHPRPFAKQAAELRKAFMAAVTPEDLAAVARKLTEKAKNGDLLAAKLLLAWTLGQPDTPYSPDAVDLPAAGDQEQNTESRVFSVALAPCPEPSVDYDTRRKMAVEELGRLVLVSRAAEAAAQNALPPEASALP